MKKKLDPALFDERVLDRNITRGLITRKDYEDFLASLPNDEDNVDHTVIEVDDREDAFEFSDESDEDDE